MSCAGTPSAALCSSVTEANAIPLQYLRFCFDSKRPAKNKGHDLNTKISQNASRPCYSIGRTVRDETQPRSPLPPTDAATINGPCAPRASGRRRTWDGKRLLPLPFKFPAAALHHARRLL